MDYAMKNLAKKAGFDTGVVVPAFDLDKNRPTAQDAALIGAGIGYYYQKETDVVVSAIAPDYQPVGILTTPDLPAGTIEIGMSWTYVFDTTNRSAQFRHRINGGAWTEFVSEPKDVTDTNPAYYAYPIPWAGGVVTLEFEAAREAVATLTIQYLDLIIKGVG